MKTYSQFNSEIIRRENENNDEEIFRVQCVVVINELMRDRKILVDSPKAVGLNIVTSNKIKPIV